ncbi:lipase family protein [Corynebacterium sp.]|uniref:lipase family protein n=1 Tax=Corynebacterium sp. TaxID=1720 RepID=UPI002A917546|nr:lipase family protein [Corynebacterium sp.]MDY5784660.1 lipase family protein [Corynebacterium sp.]
MLMRATLPYAVDALSLFPRTDPDFGAATWLTGVTPGTLLRATEVHPVGLRTRLNPVSAYRIDYATSDSRSRCLTATGAVIRSRRPWRGNGPRPTIAFAPSTQGVAPRCDPSYSCTVGFAVRRRPWDAIAAYEQPVISLFTAAGADVVLTDYPRDPEDNVQLYGDHFSAARSLVDATRAARALGVGTQALGLWGYSQGGGAIGAWLEEPEYAPELQPLAAVVGAPPANLTDVLSHVDGSMLAVVALYAVAGLVAWDAALAEEVYSVLSPAGAQAVVEAGSVCAIGAVVNRPWARTEEWTTLGVPMSDVLENLPHTGARLGDMALGNRRPLRIPTRFWGAVNDDVIPFASLAHLSQQWGIDLEARRLRRIPGRTGANHIAPYFLHAPRDVKWLLDSVAG